jgi:subtilisin family serine protease
VQQDLVLGACSSSQSNADQGALCPGMENAYLIGAGTSFATPHVSGEAAVVKAQANGFIKGQALETCLLNTATKVNGVRPDSLYNYGRIDVLRAVKSSSCQ